MIAMSALFGSTPQNGGTDALTTCPICSTAVSQGMPYCAGCGSRLDELETTVTCEKCGATTAASAKFCSECGYGLTPGARPNRRTSAITLPVIDAGVELVRIDESGKQVSTHPLVSEKVTIGRTGSDITFPDDPYLSPRHAELTVRKGILFVRDLGSRNGTWHFLEQPQRLEDGDLILIGSQILRYRRLGYPGPNPPEADATRRLGSLTPAADIASLTQLRSDGSGRDTLHLSPGRNVNIGRDQGDWIFAYDPSMSGLHASIQSEDADFILVDAGSRNGVAVNVRGEVELGHGSRILVGDKMLRVNIP